jgi:hypothetical protein
MTEDADGEDANGSSGDTVTINLTGMTGGAFVCVLSCLFVMPSLLSVQLVT